MGNKGEGYIDYQSQGIEKVSPSSNDNIKQIQESFNYGRIDTQTLNSMDTFGLNHQLVNGKLELNADKKLSIQTQYLDNQVINKGRDKLEITANTNKLSLLSQNSTQLVLLAETKNGPIKIFIQKEKVDFPQISPDLARFGLSLTPDGKKLISQNYLIQNGQQLLNELSLNNDVFSLSMNGNILNIATKDGKIFNLPLIQKIPDNINIMRTSVLNALQNPNLPINFNTIVQNWNNFNVQGYDIFPNGGRENFINMFIKTRLNHPEISSFALNLIGANNLVPIIGPNGQMGFNVLVATKTGQMKNFFISMNGVFPR